LVRSWRKVKLRCEVRGDDAKSPRGSPEEFFIYTSKEHSSRVIMTGRYISCKEFLFEQPKK
jgi:hypothetical protein